jgi:hypothetical protein
MTERQKRTGRPVKNPVEYCSYWRCEVKRCNQCENKRPLDCYHFTNRALGQRMGICRSCRNEYLSGHKKKNREKANLYAKNWRRRNPEKRKAAWKRYYDKVRDERLWRAKTYAVEHYDKHGMSIHQKYGRDFHMRPSLFRTPIRKRYGFSATSEELREHFCKRRTYVLLFKAFKDSGFDRAKAPVVYFDGDKITSLSQLRVMTYGEARSMITKNSWKEGTYENRKRIDYRHHLGLDKRNSNGRFERGGSAVRITKTGQELASGSLPVETEGRAL